jgi:hypothetical protein
LAPRPALTLTLSPKERGLTNPTLEKGTDP